jgi:hypothetical protein
MFGRQGRRVGESDVDRSFSQSRKETKSRGGSRPRIMVCLRHARDYKVSTEELSPALMPFINCHVGQSKII